jgi:hypothetical protein
MIVMCCVQCSRRILMIMGLVNYPEFKDTNIDEELNYFARYDGHYVRSFMSKSDCFDIVGGMIMLCCVGYLCLIILSTPFRSP